MGNCLQENNNIREEQPIFSLEGEKCQAYCTSVYDGDTVTLNIKSERTKGVYAWKVRLSGLDAPELHPRLNDPTHDIQKIHAEKCRQVVMHFLLHKECTIMCGKFDKYGRLLGIIWVNSLKESLNDWLLGRDIEGRKNTPCVPYDGKAKSAITYDKTYCKLYNL
jgi:endonuclease YncB( thermonuclease family)